MGEFIRGMKVLVTGATSFVGGFLVKALEQKGHEVFCLVRTASDFKKEIIWDFKSQLPADIPVCDGIIHLAAYVDFSQDMKVEQYEVNTVSTLKLSLWARDNNSWFIFASMAGLHGGERSINCNSPIAPPNHYAMSKYLAEQAIEQTLTQFYILRIGGIYGINGPKHLGLNTAITEAFENKKVPVLKGGGAAQRNYISVEDVVKWIIALVDKFSVENVKESERIIYMASEEVLSIREYLLAISEILLGTDGLEELPGSNGAGCIIESSVAPVTLRTFKEYLMGLSCVRVEK